MRGDEELGGFVRMETREHRVDLGHVGVKARLFVVARFMVLGGFAMVSRRLLVMPGRVTVMRGPGVWIHGKVCLT